MNLIKWFLIGCGILTAILIPSWIWNMLTPSTQEILNNIFCFVLVSTIIGAVVYAIYTDLIGAFL